MKEMKTLTIQIPDDETELVIQLLEKLKVKIVSPLADVEHKPNALTAKVIDEARKGKGLGKPIKDIKSFMSSL